MKGCVSLIIKTIIAVLVFFGLVHLGIIDYIREKISEHTNASQEQIIDKAKDILDFSDIDDEYSMDKNLKILKNRMIIAEHNATGQKMIMIEPVNENILTKDDIKNDKIQEKLEGLIKKYKYQPVKFDKIEITKHGELKGIDQVIPYAKADVVVSNIPVKNMDGIIGVAELKNGKNLIVISVNEKGKYSQIITDAFYKKVKLCQEDMKD